MADNPILSNVDFSFRRGPKAKYNQTAMKEGSLNICLDTDELFADIDGRRVPLSGILVYDTESEIFALTNPEPVIYYAINTNIMYHFDPTELRWTQMTYGTADEGHEGFVVSAEASGYHSIIFHRGNGSTFEVNTQDLDTTYSTGNSTYSGLTKIYDTTGTNEDGTIDQNTLTELLNGKVSNVDGVAPKATNDATGQKIDETYIKDVDVAGRQVTFTKGDGSSFSIMTQDTNDNTTYSTGSSTYSGLTRLYSSTGTNTNGTMTQKAIKESLDGKLSTAGTAYAAEFDSRGQQIANTYIKEIKQNIVDPHIFTITWGNGTTTAIETVDNNTTYGAATANSLGLTKLFSSQGASQDGTMTQAAITTALTGKLATTGTAYKAANDEREQKIDSTYIKNVTVDGQIVTFTKGDGSTFSIMTQDTKIDTLGPGTSSTLGFTKLYLTKGTNTDGTINQKALTNFLNNLLPTSGTASKATADATGQKIDETYIKDVDVAGREVTFTKGDNSTFKITTQDQNTTYTQGTSTTLGLVKLYASTGDNTDGTMTQKAVKDQIDFINGTNIINVEYSDDTEYLKMTRGDHTTFSHKINNTTYDTANGSTSGLTKLYDFKGENTDGTIRQKELSEYLDNKLDVDATAVAATKDGNAQNIAETYIKGASTNQTTVTFTRGDSSTFNINTKDTTYSTGTTATSGLTKLYDSTGNSTDGTMTRKAISDALDGKLSSAGTAPAAVKDNKNQTIDETYIKDASVDGTSVTFTKGDGSTFSVTTQDSNTTYAQATSAALGLVKLYGSTGTNTDGTMTQSAIKTQLDGKLSTSGTAAAATNDSDGNKISETYIKEVETAANTIVFKRGDNTTFVISTQDIGTYSIGNESVAGITNIYGSTGTSTAGSIHQSALTSLLNDKVSTNSAAFMSSASANDQEITFTKGDGSTFKVTTKDTTYSTGTTGTAGLTKLYTSVGTGTDGTMTRTAIKNALDGKLATNSASFMSSASANQTTVTFTKGDGSTFKINTKDTTYSTGTSTSAGLTKLYTSTGNSTDGAMTRKATTDAITNGSVNKAKYDFADNEISKYIKTIEQDATDNSLIKITKGDGSTQSFTTIDKRTVTTAFSRNTNGLVPGPSLAAESNQYYLAGNCTWVELNTTLGGLVNTIALASSASNDDIIITNRDNSTYSINLSDYGYEGDDEETEDLTIGGTVTTYSYNESTYDYRIGQVGIDDQGDSVEIEVVNNSTFAKFDPEDEEEEEIGYNNTSIYCERIS